MSSDDSVGTPKHVGAFDWTLQKSGHLMHLLVFYKDRAERLEELRNYNGA
jgi:hypothetical protein